MVVDMSIFSKAFLEEEDLETCPRSSLGTGEQLAVPALTGIKMFLKCNKSANAKWTAMPILVALEQTLSEFISPARFVMLLSS